MRLFMNQARISDFVRLFKDASPMFPVKRETYDKFHDEIIEAANKTGFVKMPAQDERVWFCKR